MTTSPYCHPMPDAWYIATNCRLAGDAGRDRRPASNQLSPLRLAAAEDEAEGGAFEREVAANDILDVATVAEVGARRIVEEDHERRRIDFGLRRVEELQAPALRRGGRRLLGDGLAQRVVQHAGID